MVKVCIKGVDKKAKTFEVATSVVFYSSKHKMMHSQTHHTNDIFNGCNLSFLSNSFQHQSKIRKMKWFELKCNTNFCTIAAQFKINQKARHTRAHIIDRQSSCLSHTSRFYANIQFIDSITNTSDSNAIHCSRAMLQLPIENRDE